MENCFKKEDKQKLIDFVNFVATRAIFPDWKTEDTITHFKHLSFIQQVLIPKIDANILEIERVVDHNAKEDGDE